MYVMILRTIYLIFLLSVQIHNYNTRLSSKMSYAIHKVRTNYGIFNIRFQGSKVWNDISDHIKLLPLKSFKKNLKLILIEKY